MSRYINNYVKRERLRAGLSQDELAFLLGCHSGAKISRYENLERDPCFETALACQAVFGTDVSRLFPGAYTLVERQVNRRATVLREVAAERGGVNGVEIRPFLFEFQASRKPEPRPELWEKTNRRQLF